MSIAIPGYVEPAIGGAQLLMVLAVLGGLWLALGRTSLEAKERARSWALIAVPFLLWAALAWLLSVSGALEARPGVFVAPIAFAILLPTAIGAFLLTRSRRVAEILDAAPPAWLVGVQVYRVLGAVFLALLAQGLLPREFALPAGIGDVFIGASGLALAFWLASGSSLSRKAAYAWNIFGIADLVVAVATGFLTSPGPFHQLALDDPNMLISAYPLAMVPAFAVPAHPLDMAAKPADKSRAGNRKGA